MKRHGRSIAREVAVQHLYAFHISNNQECLVSKDKLANEYILAVVEHIQDIDNMIKPKLSKWTINQLNPVELSILELAVYEIVYKKMNPAIIINEALELTDKFSAPEAKRFIHKILDLIYKDNYEQ